jgi:gliding motility-associated-like protein
MNKKLIYIIFSILFSLGSKSQICSGTLGAPIFNEDFGSGSAIYGPALPSGVTGYLYSTGVPANGTYAISNTGNPSGTVGYVPDNDHTGNPNGYMMVVNADYGSTEVYRKQITGLCPNTTYVFSAYLANNNTPAAVIANCGASYIYPNVKFRVEYPVSVIQASVNSGNLPLAVTGSTLNWQQYGFVFNTVAGQTSADIIMSNNAPGGCGNDYVVDDITFSPCGPGLNISISPSNTLVCSGQSLTLLSNYTSGSYTTPQYQWQYSTNGGVSWTNIVGANSPNYPIASASSTNAGMYQLLASENGNILNSSCRIIAGPVSFSVASLTVNSPSICLGQSATLIASSATSYIWSSGSTTNSIVVTPTSTTNYTINANFGTCSTQTVTTVSIIPQPTLTVNSGSICAGGSFVMSPLGAINYTFSGGSATVTPIATSNYTILGSSGASCSGSITCNVSVIPIPILTLNSGTICSGNSFTLNPSGATSYTYSSLIAIINPTITSTFTVTGINSAGCSNTATTTIYVANTPTLTVNSGSVCLGESFTITPSGMNVYLLSSPSNIVAPGYNASYTVIGTNTVGCISTQTAISTVIVKPKPIINAGRDTLINIDESVVLHGTGDVVVGFLSMNGESLICNFCPDVEVSPNSTTCYLLKGENSFNCIAYDEVCVTVKKDWEVYIPNAFTPNEDGDDEFFLPIGYGIVDIKLIIFDRWGNQIFKSTDAQKGWNGKFGGKICEQGIYVYLAEITTMAGLLKNKVGHVSLLGNLK